MWNREGWQRVAKRLIEARVAAGFLRRSDFARHHNLGNDRTLYDIENARRDNYGVPMIMMLERIYGLASGEIQRLVDGEPVPAEADEGQPLSEAEDNIRKMPGITDAEREMLVAVLRAKRAEHGIGTAGDNGPPMRSVDREAGEQR